MNDLTTGKMMTVKEISEALQVPVSTIHLAMDRLNIVKVNGKTTYLDEKQIAMLSKELKRSHNTDLTGTRKVESTELELIERSRDLIYDLTVKVKQLSEQNGIMQPKAESFDKFLSATNSQPVGDVGKMLKIGRTTFFKMLKKDGILDSNRIPYQSHMKYFEVIDKPVKIGKEIKNIPVTMVKPEGIDYLSKKYGAK
jgi:phage antirepressor YoqD-like protein